ncbi:hypothetical protein G9464_13510 [Halostella sp. JP-L12]|uniref:hypothetical protein n=1 Tax=Halostella TaxID=1843185 RepID=UPI000EF79D03|nr:MULTISPECIES: hypothetical protein [Halostella]NHN48604.1 hypothetical protein [Halostella sp. JP-L12]
MTRLLDAVRRPEYTGERRCWPCTIVNAAVVAVASAAVLVVSLPAAVVVAALGGAAVALRGYVVPYTPRFAPKLAAALPGDLFHEDAGPSDSLGDGIDGEAVLGALVDAGVVVPEGDQLFLDDEFRASWRGETAALREMDDDALAAAVDDAAVRTDGARVDRRRRRPTVVLEADTGQTIDQRRLSYPVALAETGAARALADRLPDPELRAAAAEPLRTFLEACPACGGDVEETTEANCCGGPSHPREGPRDVLACADCGERLHTF